MADTDLTGATKEVAVDVAAVDKRKKVIKYVIIVVVVLVAIWLVKKYVLKK
jgi:hypothetical protein